MGDEAERERLRRTFDKVADAYQAARPDYPAALYEDLLTVTGLAPGDRILEIGCATGKATLPLARRGFPMTCIELGTDLARAARANLAGYDVSVVEGAFESWRPSAGVSFGLAFAATACNGDGAACLPLRLILCGRRCRGFSFTSWTRPT